MKFTQIADRLQYPAKIKADLSTHHTNIINYAIQNFQDTLKFKKGVIALMNRVSAAVLCCDVVELDYNSPNILDSVPIDDDFNIEQELMFLYIDYKSVEWDIDTADSGSVQVKESKPITTPKQVNKTVDPTPKENLYLKAPTIPLMDTRVVWLSFFSPQDNEVIEIHPSIPIVPTMQREISLTTDVNIMTNADLMNLFPNRYINTRAAVMYTPVSGLEFDEQLGVIFPVEGFTTEQVRENIIKYPHFFQLDRWVKDECLSFYSHIEIDGTLNDTLSFWDNLPESKVLPKTAEFIKEYVVRRYLLERDIKGIEHKYPMRGSLNPFLTLFTTPADYAKFGYGDPIALARQCVEARVSFFYTRNPVIAKYKALKGSDTD